VNRCTQIIRACTSFASLPMIESAAGVAHISALSALLDTDPAWPGDDVFAGNYDLDVGEDGRR
jgi:hypothetical protein